MLNRMIASAFIYLKQKNLQQFFGTNRGLLFLSYFAVSLLNCIETDNTETDKTESDSIVQ